MELSPLYSWICFMICLGLTAGGVLVVFRRREYQKFPSFRYLQYYLILIYTFGFYALWSQWLFRSLYMADLKNENMVSLARFLALLSVPFLLVGKAMLVLWAISLLTKISKRLTFPVLITLALLIFLIYLPGSQPWTLLRIYASFVLLVLTGVSTMLLFGGVKYLSPGAGMNLVGLVSFTGLVHVPLLLTLPESPVIELLFMLGYFLSHTLFVTYFAYRADLPRPAVVHVQSPVTFEDFVDTYSITPREAEIIREIYQGKTNQQIADQLFVTVQTIKDHTHRIYQKTEVKNRTQLASLVRNYQQ